jgi:hypothetical protein
MCKLQWTQKWGGTRRKERKNKQERTIRHVGNESICEKKCGQCQTVPKEKVSKLKWCK